MKGQIIHVAGTPTDSQSDISGSVQMLYNLVAQSSGVYSINELESVALLGELCGFERSGDVRKYVDSLHRQSRGKILRDGVGA